MQLSPLVNPSCSDLTNPEKNIECGVDYLYYIFKNLEKKTDKKDDYIKLVLAAYYSDVGLVKNLPDNDFEYLPEKVKNYVFSIIGDYVCYGGLLDSTENLPWYYNNEKIIPRPFGVKIKAEDYLIAIDCSDMQQRLFYWTSTPQLLCCGGESNNLQTGQSMCGFNCGPSGFS